MSALLHLIVISLKGLLVFASIFGGGAGAIILLFGARAHNPDVMPGIMGGGVLLFVLLFGGAYVFLGGPHD